MKPLTQGRAGRADAAAGRRLRLALRTDGQGGSGDAAEPDPVQEPGPAGAEALEARGMAQTEAAGAPRRRRPGLIDDTPFWQHQSTGLAVFLARDTSATTGCRSRCGSWPWSRTASISSRCSPCCGRRALLRPGAVPEQCAAARGDAAQRARGRPGRPAHQPQRRRRLRGGGDPHPVPHRHARHARHERPSTTVRAAARTTSSWRSRSSSTCSTTASARWSPTRTRPWCSPGSSSCSRSTARCRPSAPGRGGRDGQPGHDERRGAAREGVAAWSSRYFTRAQDAGRRALPTSSLGTGQASGEFDDVVTAAHDGRVETLFVALGTRRWGTFDRSAGRSTCRRGRPRHRGPGRLRGAPDPAQGRPGVRGAPDQVPEGGAVAAVYGIRGKGRRPPARARQTSPDAYRRGSSTVNTVPFGSLSSTRIRPRWSETIRWTIARPSPVPRPLVEK